MRGRMTTATVMIGLALGIGCGGSKEAPTARKMHPEAQRRWDTLCVNCHHTDGSGTGPGAANLNPKPRDFRSPKWQASVTDDHLKKVIIKGGAAMGLSKEMPSNTDLMTSPKVVEDLVRKIRSLKREP